MHWSFKIGRIAGTEIRIHLALLLFLLWIGVAAASKGTLLEGASVVVLLSLVFLCVLLHEFGHVFMALFFGITTPKIVLYPFGGIAWMNRIPRDPRQEIFIAFAGPTVNLLIAVILFIVTGASLTFTDTVDVRTFSDIVPVLLWVNLAVGLFNLLPAFPMDGGRIFRALVAMRLPYEKATSLAVLVGEIFGIGMAVFSITQGNFILFLISLFLIFAAGAEGASVKREHLLEGLTAEDAAMSDFHALKLSDTIHHAATLILDGAQSDFPVVNCEGQCVAIVTRNDVLRVLRDKGPSALVSEATSEIPRQVGRGTSAAEALRELVDSGLPGAAVIDGNGQLVQWLTRENVEDLLETRSATHDFASRLLSAEQG